MHDTNILCRAAALMRERAEAATPGQWTVTFGFVGARRVPFVSIPGQDGARMPRQDDAEHIAAWHPAVALAVADWLDLEAEFATGADPGLASNEALAVARAYLGEADDA